MTVADIANDNTFLNL